MIYCSHLFKSHLHTLHLFKLIYHSLYLIHYINIMYQIRTSTSNTYYNVSLLVQLFTFYLLWLMLLYCIMYCYCLFR